MFEIDENDGNAALTSPSTAAADTTPLTPKTKFARDAGLDGSGAKRFSESEISPSLITKCDNSDFEAAGIRLRERVHLKDYARQLKKLATIHENTGVAYFLCNDCPTTFYVTRKNAARHVAERHDHPGAGYTDGLYVQNDKPIP